MTVSIGIVVVDKSSPEMNVTDILTQSDQALYRAKMLGRNTAEFFTQELNQEIQRIATFENDIKQALETKQFFLVYQPQIDLKLNTVVGCEVLIRWRHPQKGIISPSEFIPIAEDTKLIKPISEWVFDEGMAQFAEWQKKHPDLFFANHFISFNISPTQIEPNSVPKVIQYIEKILQKYSIKPSTVMFELTETAVMSNLNKIISVFQAFDKLGIFIAIDDFGTGYSSLSHLKALPVAMLKIDQSFIQDLDSSASSRAIVRGIILLADALNIKTVAEGVENQVQFDYLKDQGCNYSQGFYTARPMTAEDFEKFVINYGSKAKKS